jgi:hypothetical protein
MEFRWITVIALWTLLIGPIMSVPSASSSKSAAGAAARAIKGKAVLRR